VKPSSSPSREALDRPDDRITSKVGIDATKPLGTDAAMSEKATV
jgi:hypothetical protein